MRETKRETDRDSQVDRQTDRELIIEHKTIETNASTYVSAVNMIARQ